MRDLAAGGKTSRAHLSRFRNNLIIRGTSSSPAGRVGLAVLALLVLAVLVGPLFSPESPTAIVGAPYEHPSWNHLLGLDSLGRDVLSRFLVGGRVLLGVAFAATLLAYAVGILIGMAAGFRHGIFDLGTVAVVDLVISFPPIVLVLILVAGAGTGLSIVTLAIAAVHTPRVVRLVRAVTLDVATREFVEASVARGEATISVLRRDILPNILVPLLADFGIRLSGSVILFASLSYLGVGQRPPASDWGLMISENQPGIFVQPWVIVAPAVAIALLSVSVNLISDSIARSLGRTITSRAV
jgi:peptide/nickel transport system permease protein